VFELVTAECQPMWPLGDGSCAFGPFGTQDLIGLEFEELLDNATQISKRHVLDKFVTGIGLGTFNEEYCAHQNAPNEVQNTTSSYNSQVKIRNRPFPDWAVPPTFVRFFEPIIVQVSVDAGANIRPDIDSVELIFTNADTGEVLQNNKFNKADKAALMEFEWSPFYDDVHFCSWYEQDQCEVFYEGNRTSTPYATNVILPQLADLCQTSQPGNTDHFSFLPTRWIEGFNVPRVGVEIRTVSVLRYCGGAADAPEHTDRRRLGATPPLLRARTRCSPRKTWPTYSSSPPSSS